MAFSDLLLTSPFDIMPVRWFFANYPTLRHGQKGRLLLPFLQGLLPDSADRLKQLGREHHVNPNNPVALLENVGADAAGAIQILPHGHESSDAATRVGDVAELSDSEFSELIADLIKNKDTWGSDRRHGSQRGQ